MKITIEQRHIDNGECVSAHKCAISAAVHEALLPGYIFVISAGGGWCVWQRNNCEATPNARGPSPQAAKDFIHVYDCRGKRHARPITFDLPIDEFCKPQGEQSAPSSRSQTAMLATVTARG